MSRGNIWLLSWRHTHIVALAVYRNDASRECATSAHPVDVAFNTIFHQFYNLIQLLFLLSCQRKRKEQSVAYGKKKRQTVAASDPVKCPPAQKDNKQQGYHARGKRRKQKNMITVFSVD